MNKGAILSLLFVGLITGSYLEFEMNLARVADEEDGDDLTIVAEGVGLPPGRGTSEFADNVPQPVRGVAVEASFNSEALPDRLIVPRSAILLRGSEDRRPVLFVYEPNGSWGLAKWRYVNLGEENETHVEILAEGPEEGAVEPGEIVLVDGHHYLAHDTPIRLVEDVAAEMRILSFLTDPPISPARGPPQGDFSLDQTPASDRTPHKVGRIAHP